LKYSEGMILASRNESAWAIEDELQSTFLVVKVEIKVVGDSASQSGRRLMRRICKY